MDWIKRNSILVAAGAVVLVLFGGAGFFLWTNLSKHAAVSSELERESGELARLYQARPSINPDNLKSLGEDKQRLQELQDKAKQRFPSADTKVNGITEFEFKKRLDETLFQLTKDAETANVTIPLKYNFTFEEQKKAVAFNQTNLPVLAARLEEVRSIVETLYKAQVHSVDRVRRVIVSTEDRIGSPDYLVQTPVTNELAGMVRIPYEVTFSGFTKELASVIDGLYAAPEFFVVRNIFTEPAPAPVAAVAPTAAPIIILRPGFQQPVAIPRSSGGCDDCGGGCCGGDCGGGGAPARPVLPAYPTQMTPRIVQAPPKLGVNILLDERLLRFTLTLDVIVPISTNSVPGSESSAGAVSTGAN